MLYIWNQHSVICWLHCNKFVLISAKNEKCGRIWEKAYKGLSSTKNLSRFHLRCKKTTWPLCSQIFSGIGTCVEPDCWAVSVECQVRKSTTCVARSRPDVSKQWASFWEFIKSYFKSENSTDPAINSHRLCSASLLWWHAAYPHVQKLKKLIWTELLVSIFSYVKRQDQTISGRADSFQFRHLLQSVSGVAWGTVLGMMIKPPSGSEGKIVKTDSKYVAPRAG